MIRLLLLFSVIIPFTISAQMMVSQNSKADIAVLSKYWHNQHDISEELRTALPINRINGIDYLSLVTTINEHFNADLLTENRVIVGSEINNIVSIKYPVHAINDIYNMPGIEILQVANKIYPDLSRARFDTRVDSVHAGLGLPEAYTGKNVIIGVTDWGFDYSSPMFYDTLLSNTRILAAWDQFKTSGPAPSGYAYGTEYSTPSDLINAGTDTANIYSYATHGSHVAGIAGGSGAGTPYRGMAFESEFLFTTFLVDESAVLDAWEWMYDIATAENKRLVVNMSWGLYHTGALDGTSLLSQAIDSYSDQGVLFVTSGGNNGDVDFHIKKDFSADTLLSRIEFYNNSSLSTLYGQSIHGWGEPGASFSAGIKVLNLSNQQEVESPWYSTVTTANYVDSFLVTTSNDTIRFNLSMDDSYPTNSRPQMRLRVKRPTTNYKIVLKSTASTGTVHYWNVTELTSDVGNWGMDFSAIGPGYTSGDANYGIGAPACTNTAISVAAHTSSYITGGGNIVGGASAGFSSVGPMMNDNLKPDISAPGVSVASSINSYTDNSFIQIDVVTFNGRDYPFARFSGTSMSSPAVTGIAALILDANPYLSPAQVKQIIIETSREDSYTGTIPVDGDVKWGWGKVNALAAIQKALTVTGFSELEPEYEWTVFPNPTTDLINIKGFETTPPNIKIINMNGQICAEYSNTNQLDVNGLAPGTYIIKLIINEKVEQQKFIIR